MYPAQQTQPSHLETYQQRPFINYTQQSPQIKRPYVNQIQNVHFTHQKNTQQIVNTPLKSNKQYIETKSDKKQIQKPNKQTENLTPTKKGLNIQEEKKFTPLSYKNQPKYLVEQDENTKKYTKQTVQIVLVGFMILILIVGSFYSLILWNKMKANQSQQTNTFTVMSNSSVPNNTVTVKQATKLKQVQSTTQQSKDDGSTQQKSAQDNKQNHQLHLRASESQEHESVEQLQKQKQYNHHLMKRNYHMQSLI